MGKSKLWAWLEKSGKRLAIILGILASVAGIYKYVGVKVEKALIQPFQDIEELRRGNAVTTGVLMDLSNRVEGDKTFIVNEQLVLLFEVAPNVIYAFVSDDRLGYIPYRTYWDKSKLYWYYHCFEKESYSVIEEK